MLFVSTEWIKHCSVVGYDKFRTRKYRLFNGRPIFLDLCVRRAERFDNCHYSAVFTICHDLGNRRAFAFRPTLAGRLPPNVFKTYPLNYIKCIDFIQYKYYMGIVYIFM